MRPFIFFAGFFLIIVGPQALFHISQRQGWIPKKNLVWVAGEGSSANAKWQAREALLTVKDGRFTQPAALYGPSLDAGLVSDLRERLANVFGQAKAAEMAVLRSGATVVLAQFSDANAARSAFDGYAIAMLGAAPPLASDGTRTVQRASDVIKMVVAGNTMIAYSAPDAASAASLLANSPVVVTAQAGAQHANREQEFWLYRASTLVPLTLVLLLIAVVWFFRMSMWASEVPAVANAEPVASDTLRERLLAVNSLDVPFSIAPWPEDPSILVVTWRYADAKWIDLARAHGTRRTHRILIAFDDARKMVRPLEQLSTLDWSAGKDGGSVRWAMQRSITFYQYERTRVFGLQLDSNNRFTSNLSYSYTFNLAEMKAPLIQAVTQAGWTWRPTLMRGPKWLSWLTN